MKKIALLITLCLVSAMICACSYDKSITYYDAKLALKNFQFEDAKDMFESLGSYEDSERLLQYTNAFIALKKGYYTDSNGRIINISIFDAQTIIENMDDDIKNELWPGYDFH